MSPDITDWNMLIRIFILFSCIISCLRQIWNRNRKMTDWHLIDLTGTTKQIRYDSYNQIKLILYYMKITLNCCDSYQLYMNTVQYGLTIKECWRIVLLSWRCDVRLIRNRTRHHFRFKLFLYFRFQFVPSIGFWYPFSMYVSFVCLCVGAFKPRTMVGCSFYLLSFSRLQQMRRLCLAVCMLSTSITKRKVFNENDVLKILSDLKRNRLNWTVFKSILYFFFQPHTHAERLNEW